MIRHNGVILELVPPRGEKYFKPRPQNRIFNFGQKYSGQLSWITYPPYFLINIGKIT